MPTISVEQLQEHLAGVLLHVREQKAEYTITEQGQAIALLVPIDEDEARELSGDTAQQPAATGWDAYAEFVQQQGKDQTD